MADFDWLFPLPVPVGDGDAADLVCLEVCRSLPGKRLSCVAAWQGRRLFAKIFCDPRRARAHWRREAEGVAALLERNILAPAPIYTGPSGRPGVFVALYEFVEDGKSAAAVWEAESEEGRLALLKRLVALLGRHHRAGLMQRDLHLENFLVVGDEIYTLDGDGISLSPEAVALGGAMENLAWLFAQLFPRYDTWLERVLPAYDVDNEFWKMRDAGLRLKKLIREKRWARKEHFLAKTLRACSAFCCRRNWREFVVYDRAWSGEAFDALLADLDSAITKGKALKKGNTCTVAGIAFGGSRLVIKRYNIKNWRHALGRAFRPSRASVSWRNAHRLLFYGIDTAKPVALLEKRWGPLRGKAYYICEYVPGVDAAAYFREDTVAPVERERVVEKIADLLANLQALAISHGDMKATNFIVGAHGIRLVDLDSMREHFLRGCFVRAWKRDVARFLRNWCDATAVREAFIRKLQARRVVGVEEAARA